MDTLAPSSTRPSLYGQLTDEFRARILSGELKPGERLPSFTEMREQHRVSQATLNRVHGLLEAEGLIERRRGAGTFVCDPSDSPAGLNGGGPLSFLSSAVVILTPFGKPTAAHQSSGWLEWIALGASEAVRQAGMHALALNPEISDSEVDRLIAEKPFGALIPANLSESATPVNFLRKLRARGIATVVFGSSSDVADCDRVVSDHQNGAYQLTRLMIERGKKRIINVQPLDWDEPWLEQRQLGYERAMNEAGLSLLPILKIPTTFALLPSAEGQAQGNKLSLSTPIQDRQAFEAQVRSLAGYFVEALTGSEPVEGILAITDRNTFLFAAVCRLFGLDPNREVLIAGYDNYFTDCEENAIAPFSPVATIDKNNRALGAAMVQLLLDRVNGQLEDTPQKRVIEPQLVVTAS